MAFFSAEGNETGKLQSRIDRGIMSLSNTVNNFFIEILPLFSSAVLALVPSVTVTVTFSSFSISAVFTNTKASVDVLLVTVSVPSLLSATFTVTVFALSFFTPATAPLSVIV